MPENFGQAVVKIRGDWEKESGLGITTDRGSWKLSTFEETTFFGVNRRKAKGRGDR